MPVNSPSFFMRERGEEVESELEDEDRDVMGLRELVRGQGGEAESGETTGEATGSPDVEVC